jgi:hypothetical protein
VPRESAGSVPARLTDRAPNEPVNTVGFVAGAPGEIGCNLLEEIL